MLNAQGLSHTAMTRSLGINLALVVAKTEPVSDLYEHAPAWAAEGESGLTFARCHSKQCFADFKVIP